MIIKLKLKVSKNINQATVKIIKEEILNNLNENWEGIVEFSYKEN
jgi:hypothetical protein